MGFHLCETLLSVVVKGLIRVLLIAVAVQDTTSSLVHFDDLLSDALVLNWRLFIFIKPISQESPHLLVLDHPLSHRWHSGVQSPNKVEDGFHPLVVAQTLGDQFAEEL